MASVDFMWRFILFGGMLYFSGWAVGKLVMMPQITDNERKEGKTNFSNTFGQEKVLDKVLKELRKE